LNSGGSLAALATPLASIIVSGYIPVGLTTLLMVVAGSLNVGETWASGLLSRPLSPAAASLLAFR
jgi:hypothetical protein